MKRHPPPSPLGHSGVSRDGDDGDDDDADEKLSVHDTLIRLSMEKVKKMLYILAEK